MKFDMSGGAAVLEASARSPRWAAGPRGRRDRRDREHPVSGRAVSPATSSRRRRHDDRGQQHRRRGPARAGRLPPATPSSGRRAAGRPGHADRRSRRARLTTRADEHDDELGDACSRPPPATGEPSGDCRCTRTTPADRGQLRRPRQRPEARKAGSITAAGSCTASPARCRGHTSTSPGRLRPGRAYAARAPTVGVRLLVELAHSY